MMARECQRRAHDAGLDYVFKASYDKANRSSHASYRGPGMHEGLDALAQSKGRPAARSDGRSRHLSSRMPPRSPTFCKSPRSSAVRRLNRRGVPDGPRSQRQEGSSLRLRTRATSSRRRAPPGVKSFYSPSAARRRYNNLVVDMRAFPIMRAFGAPVVFDVSTACNCRVGWKCNGRASRIHRTARTRRRCLRRGRGLHGSPRRARTCPLRRG